MNLFLTGTNGFIGKNLLNNLKRKHRNIKTVDFENADYDPFEFLKKFKEIAKKDDVVIHNGACSSTTETCPFKMNKLNFEYSQQLLKLCIEKKVRLIYASSASVYGDGPFKETSLKQPKNIYGLSKSMFDDYSQQFIDNIPQIVGLRYFNVYGPNEDKKGNMASVVYKFYNQVKLENKIKVFKGSENFLRDFVYIDDIINITNFFIDNKDISGIYNCGTGLERSFQDIADIFVKKYNCKINYIDMPSNLKGKYQKFTKSDNAKINKIFNETRISLEDGVKKYLRVLDENIY